MVKYSYERGESEIFSRRKPAVVLEQATLGKEGVGVRLQI